MTTEDVELLIKPEFSVEEEEACRIEKEQQYDVDRDKRSCWNQLYGSITPSERRKVALLSGTLFFIIGGYWLLRSLKDSVLAALVGLEYQPVAKVASLFVVLVAVVGYNKLVDLVPRHKLFYITGAVYGGLFAIISLLLADPTIGLSADLPPSPSRWLGWLSYFAIESYGSIAVSLFWAFVNSTYSYEGAKASYGLIIAGAQIGSILGPSIVSNVRYFGGIPIVYFAGALSPLCAALMISLYMRLNPTTKSATSSPAKNRTGVLEGVKLLYQYPYVLGIFGISCIFEVVITIMDYEMKVLGKQQYPSIEDFASFMGHFGQAVNVLSFVVSLLGTSVVFRTCGLRRVLMAFPVLVIVAVSTVFVAPSLWVTFGAMIFLKALTYAINNPAKEMLYTVTSSTIKFKAKSWIDIFGGRLAKATGSAITNSLKSSLNVLLVYGSLVSIVIGSVLFLLASVMGRRFTQLLESQTIIGDDDEEDSGIQ